MSEEFQPPRAAEASIDVVRFEEKHRQLWDDFVAQSNQGTLFHTRAFLAYHPPDRFHDDSLLFLKKGRLIAVLPAALLSNNPDTFLCSHPGASFGGFVTPANLPVRDANALVASLLAYCHQRRYAGVELTLPPHVYWVRPNDHFEYVLHLNRFTYRKREVSSIVPVELSKEMLAREYWRAVRRAQKRAVAVRESDELPLFYEYLQSHMQSRHEVKPTHALEELMHLRTLLPGQIRLFAAYAGLEMISGMLLFICNPRVALAFYYVSFREGFQHFHGFELLMFEVLRWCREQGFRHLDFGTFTLDSKPNWGLASFKESFGAQGVFRNTMFLKW